MKVEAHATKANNALHSLITKLEKVSLDETEIIAELAIQMWDSHTIKEIPCGMTFNAESRWLAEMRQGLSE